MEAESHVKTFMTPVLSVLWFIPNLDTVVCDSWQLPH